MRFVESTYKIWEGEKGTGLRPVGYNPNFISYMDE